MKEKILLEDDGLVTQNSDEELDWAQVLGQNGDGGTSYDAYDPYPHDSDGGDSWHSLELKTPPNSDKELSDAEVDDAFLVFAEAFVDNM
ncbi:hypothetical protein PIB30_049008 [Stylosanthes scabra]|uniref:Uncharacterized protein n=1 Tax=Stylosanthes scabra TaxID=79078 RepID=A0ABU6ZG00_9FABA|nr:hypothetical protein [Stylosanthes scabra]